MSNEMKIGGVTVNLDNPCQVLAELRKAEIAIATGESVSVARFGDDETRFTPASMAGLKSLIAEYERKCGATQGRRVRYAKAIRWGAR